jgi:hypothetical protein
MLTCHVVSGETLSTEMTTVAEIFRGDAFTMNLSNWIVTWIPVPVVAEVKVTDRAEPPLPF